MELGQRINSREYWLFVLCGSLGITLGKSYKFYEICTLPMKKKKILVTAALPYANGPLHIGHLAGCYLPADIYTRHQRQRGHLVHYICGTDEHGVPITIRAMREGTTPQAVVDKYHALIRDSFAAMDIDFSIFSRTSTALHTQTAQDFFTQLYSQGVFEEKVSEQYYDEERGVYLADRYIVGTCPICGNENAYGDQCEKCGSSLEPEQLINPRSALSNATPIKRETKHWYFPLDRSEAFLKEWIIEGKKGIWKPNVYGQCKSWIDSGLQPRAMTRDSNWGVPVPLPDAEGKVLYVWFDAPIGYISATKELLPDTWQDFWQEEDTKLVQFIGKDNIVFHCIIFPAMLQAHGGYILPDNVPANEFLNIEGQKVSTSRDWAVWIHEYAQDFPDMQDTMRYVLCANAPESKDNDFTWTDFQARNNSELVATLGNFINRVMVLTHKYCRGRVPYLHQDLLNDQDKGISDAVLSTKDKIEKAIDHYRFRDALYEVMELARIGNKYLQDAAPWGMAKTAEQQAENQQRIDNILHISLQLMANFAIFTHAFMPGASRKIRHMLKVVDRMLEWQHAGRLDLVKENYPLRAPELLFRKVEDDEIAAQRQKLEERAAAAAAALATANGAADAPSHAAQKQLIEFADFEKIDLRIATILAAAPVKKADKLLQLTVDLGWEQRTLLSGIAQHYAPAELVGRQVVVVCNLAPRKMKGIESAGMVLMTQGAEGNLVFVTAAAPVPNGATIS